LAICEPQPTDFAAWSVLWEGYNRFYERSGPTALPETVTQTTWRRFFNPDEPMHAFVAELDGELIGLVHFLFHRSTSMIGPSCYLQDLFTAPPCMMSPRVQSSGRTRSSARTTSAVASVNSMPRYLANGSGAERSFSR
jgi:hypothetical protein